MDAIIEQPLHARLVTAHGAEVPVRAALRYTTADPLAVFLDFPPEATLVGEDVTWVFARALLDQGLRAPAGRGDVRISPHGPARALLEFHSPHGCALLQFRTAELRRFLGATYGVVAAGAEDLTETVERGLTALFGGV